MDNELKAEFERIGKQLDEVSALSGRVGQMSQKLDAVIDDIKTLCRGQENLNTKLRESQIDQDRERHTFMLSAATASRSILSRYVPNMVAQPARFKMSRKGETTSSLFSN